MANDKNKKDENAPNLLGELPPEMLAHIANYLTPADAAKLAQTDKRNQEIVENEINRSIKKDKEDFFNFLQHPTYTTEMKMNAINDYLRTDEYKNLQGKIKNNTATDKEIIIHALVTDDILKINQKKLINAYANIKNDLNVNMQQNISCMCAILFHISSKNSNKKLSEAIAEIAQRKVADNKNYINLAGLNLTEYDLNHVNLNNANLKHTKLVKVGAEKANFSHSDLSHSDLSGANLIGADLTGANLYRAIFKETTSNKILFNGTIFTDAILTGANFIRKSFNSGKEVAELKEDLDFLNDQIKNNPEVHKLREATARNIVRAANEIQNPRSRKEFLRAAIDHEAFQHRNENKRNVAKFARLFSANSLVLSHSQTILQKYLNTIQMTPSPKKR